MKKALVWIALVSFWAQLALAAAPTGALTYLEKRHEQVSAVLQQPDSLKRDTQLKALLKDFLDYDAIARKSLDQEWNKRSAQDRARFTALLRQLVERQYQNNMERTLNYKVRYIEGEKLGDGELVHTKARSKKNRRSPEIEISYTMREVGQNWRITDIETDGVSLVANYQRQFRRIISKEGWNGLISRMETKLKDKQGF